MMPDAPFDAEAERAAAAKRHSVRRTAAGEHYARACLESEDAYGADLAAIEAGRVPPAAKMPGYVPDPGPRAGVPSSGRRGPPPLAPDDPEGEATE